MMKMNISFQDLVLLKRGWVKWSVFQGVFCIADRDWKRDGDVRFHFLWKVGCDYQY